MTFTSTVIYILKKSKCLHSKTSKQCDLNIYQGEVLYRKTKQCACLKMVLNSAHYLFFIILV